TRDDFKLAKLILVAPALRLPLYTVILRPFMFLRYFGVSLPSRAPKSYRRHDATSFASYHATFSTVDSVQSLANPDKLRDTPGLVVLSSTDGVVHTPGIKRWIEEHALEKWEQVEVSPEPQIDGGLGHVLLDSNGAGDEAWEKIHTAISEFLRR